MAIDGHYEHGDTIGRGASSDRLWALYEWAWCEHCGRQYMQIFGRDAVEVTLCGGCLAEGVAELG